METPQSTKTTTPSPSGGWARTQEILQALDRESEEARLARELARRTIPPRDRTVHPLGREMQAVLSKSGYLTPEREAQIQASSARQAEASRRLLATRLALDAGVFTRYAGADLDDTAFVAAEMPEGLPAYCCLRDELLRLLSFPQTLIVRGGNGSGKTHLACALVNRFCQAGRAARYTTAADFFLELKSTFGEAGRTQLDLVTRYRGYELLVLDEIEVRSDSVWENNVLRGLVDARYASDLATIILTNKREEEIGTYFSTAIRDRIREDGAILSCDWPSLRGRKAARP